MAEVLLVPPGAITAEDRDLLREAGVVVVATDDAAKCQFLRAGETVGSSDMLWAAMDAIRRDFGYGDHGKQQREQLAHNLFSLIAAASDRDGGLPATVRADRKAAAAAKVAPPAKSA